jgi:hypothetical protein
MISARCYATVARVAALVLGVGSLSWSASNPERVRLLLGECRGAYVVGPTDNCPDCGHSLSWSGCEILARELMTAGALMVLGSLPVKGSDRG